MLATMGKHLLLLACRGTARRFYRHLGDIEERQTVLLNILMRDLAGTEYGRSHGITKDVDYQAYSELLPIVTYEDLIPYIQMSQSGRPNVLTQQPIHFYERTSGGMSQAKDIPCTAALVNSFSSMFKIWAYDVLQYLYRPRTGKIFMLLTPDNESVSDDRRFLSRGIQRLLDPFLVIPSGIEKSDPINTIGDALIRERELEVISVWSPSLLCVLLERYRLDSPEATFATWPNLKLISCWSAGSSHLFAKQLADYFPHVCIQGKGLLATEAPITIPLTAAGGYLPLYDEVFMEFEDDSHSIYRLHELETGKIYALIIAQQSGLYRYRLGDLVRVTGFYNGAPMLEFIGRAERVSDLVGEKLSEAYITSLLEPVIEGYFIALPIMRHEGAYYDILVSNEDEPNVDALLCASYHYRQARQLGQLTQARVRMIPGLIDLVHEFHQSIGIRAGDFKPPRLLIDPERAKAFLAFVERAAPHTTAHPAE